MKTIPSHSLWINFKCLCSPDILQYCNQDSVSKWRLPSPTTTNRRSQYFKSKHSQSRFKVIHSFIEWCHLQQNSLMSWWSLLLEMFMSLGTCVFSPSSHFTWLLHDNTHGYNIHLITEIMNVFSTLKWFTASTVFWHKLMLSY